MSSWTVVPLVLPLAAAALCLLVRHRRGLQRAVAVVVCVAVLGVGVALIAVTRDGDVIAAQVAGWPAGIAIPFVADAFSALLVTVAAVLVCACTAFAITADADESPAFHPLVLTLSAGVYGAFLTADLFNLFVLVEVMLVPSYVLLALGGSPAQLRGAGVYVAVSLLASTVFVIGVAAVYGAAGTVNLGELAGTGATSGAVAAAAGVVALALAVKVAVVPLHLWLPRCYPVAPPVVTALFSGLLTKVGLYALYRIYAVVFDGEPRYRGAVLVVAAITMVVGVLEAVGANAMRPILSHHMVSQMGYLLLGLGIFTPAGLAATLFYLIQYVVVKGALFLAAAAVEHRYGTGRLDRLGGVLTDAPLLGLAFLGAALSLAGLPPLSGFVGKLLLVRAAVLDHAYVIAGVAVVVSLGTLLSMVKIWNGAFWGTGADRAPQRPGGRHSALAAPALVLTLITVALGPAAQVLLDVCATAAEGLLDTSRYVAAVTQP